MEIPGDLIRRFFAGECTEEEKKEVMDYFRDHPEKLASQLTEDSWENYLPQKGQGVTAPTGRIRRLIAEKVGRPPVKRIFYARMAAASLVLVAGAIFLLYRAGGNKQGLKMSPGIAGNSSQPDFSRSAMRPTSPGPILWPMEAP